MLLISIHMINIVKQNQLMHNIIIYLVLAFIHFLPETCRGENELKTKTKQIIILCKSWFYFTISCMGPCPHICRLFISQ
jgi:hypothetical protein